MQPIAESELSAGTVWQSNRTHDLAHAAAAAVKPATCRHPARRAGGVGAELEWPWIDGRRFAE